MRLLPLPLPALLAALLGVAALSPVAAQDPGMRRVEARVTASSPGLATLDRGNDAGLQPGDRVRLHPLGAAVLEGRVEQVGARDATVRLNDPAAAVDIGARAEAFVPADRIQEPGGEAPGQPPAHAPWSRPPDEWTQDMPLLAKSQGRKPEQRPVEWSGRFFSSVDHTTDRGSDDDRSYLYARSGADLDARNPFGRGGELRIDFEVNHRADSNPGYPDESETGLRLDRLSWSVGGDRHAPRRWEFGRFLHREFPEFGVADGADFSARLSPANTFGASFGYLPELDSDYATGKDLQTSLYWSHTSGERRELRAGAGFQKTWHRGSADRDLFLAKLSWSPPAGLNFYSTAWVDLYGSEDTAKSSGAELTQLFSSLGWRAEGGDGVRLGYSRIRFPQLLRLQISQITLAQLSDNQTDRIDLSAWKRLNADLRLSGRVDSWSDEDDSGGGGQLRMDWRGPLFANGNLGAALFTNQGQFSSVTGLRLDADWATGLGSWRISWESAQFSQEDFVGDQEELLQHALELSWDLYGGTGWSCSSYLEQRLGDEIDSTTLGFYLQHRF